MGHLRHYKESTIAALRGIGRLLLLPRYATLTVGVFLLFAGAIFLAINAQFYGSLFLSRLPFLDKLVLLGTMYAELFRQSITTLNGALLLLVSAMQGLSLSVVIFTSRRNKRDQATTANQLGLSGLASVAAAIGLGCVPCGTSLILPIIALFFSGAAAATAANIASGIILVAALILSIVSLYKSGQIAYIYTTLSKQEKES